MLVFNYLLNSEMLPHLVLIFIKKGSNFLQRGSPT